MPSDNTDIQLFNESDTTVPLSLPDVRTAASLIEERENCHFTFLEIVYVDKEKIVEINQEHLNRDYVTDVITFRLDENEDNIGIEGTIICCAPRIYEQSLEYNEDTKIEFYRILIHGLLHLTGYEDSESDEKKLMTEKEDYYINLIK